MEVFVDLEIVYIRYNTVEYYAAPNKELEEDLSFWTPPVRSNEPFNLKLDTVTYLLFSCVPCGAMSLALSYDYYYKPEFGNLKLFNMSLDDCGKYYCTNCGALCLIGTYGKRFFEQTEHLYTKFYRYIEKEHRGLLCSK